MHAFCVAREVPPGKRKCYSTLLLDESPLPLPPDVALSSNGMVCHQLIFFFSLSLILKNVGWSCLFLIYQLQSLFFEFLIFIIDYFVKVLFIFNSNLSYIVFFSMSSYFF